ncbi:uncharacterized protein BYT42DRAFT_578232 [Radiomyces spectabilis]|uniref:uncharacterized protein n=1 Tax=Radiomyces spectabilis TaxID=64574 RepID=UPI00221FAAD0|nr:uncharacterized protein BYT42DRAFT_578232 [Radiomyces spectabilis]KAI8372852.1 hypothetical protein BYT42DRAFT_578232 [Radiomyces spectabilis]
MDEAKRLDISLLQHAVTFSGTDYGIQTMSVIVPLSVPTVSRHLRLYNRYGCLETCAYVEAEDSLSDLSCCFRNQLKSVPRTSKKYHLQEDIEDDVKN